MRRIRPGVERGFTLLELMVVVVIAGLLASIAIPSYLNYIKKARTVEAVDSLAKIAAGAKFYFQQARPLMPLAARPVLAHYLPSSSAGYSPSQTHASVCSAGNGTFPRALSTQFKTQPWPALLFGPDRDFRYRYTWILQQQSSSSTTGLAYGQALGDLDCDGIYSVWRVTLREDRDASGGYLRAIGPYIFQGPEIE